jgi:DNA-directed RNA polymerase specialized sigma24 family protein
MELDAACIDRIEAMLAAVRDPNSPTSAADFCQWLVQDQQARAKLVDVVTDVVSRKLGQAGEDGLDMAELWTAVDKAVGVFADGAQPGTALWGYVATSMENKVTDLYWAAVARRAPACLYLDAVIRPGLDTPADDGATTYVVEVNLMQGTAAPEAGPEEAEATADGADSGSRTRDYAAAQGLSSRTVPPCPPAHRWQIDCTLSSGLRFISLATADTLVPTETWRVEPEVEVQGDGSQVISWSRPEPVPAADVPPVYWWLTCRRLPTHATSRLSVSVGGKVHYRGDGHGRPEDLRVAVSFAPLTLDANTSYARTWAKPVRGQARREAASPRSHGALGPDGADPVAAELGNAGRNLVDEGTLEGLERAGLQIVALAKLTQAHFLRAVVADYLQRHPGANTGRVLTELAEHYVRDCRDEALRNLTITARTGLAPYTVSRARDRLMVAITWSMRHVITGVLYGLDDYQEAGPAQRDVVRAVLRTCFPSLAGECEARRWRYRVQAALARLADAAPKQAFLLYARDQLPVARIAAELGVSEKAAQALVDSGQAAYIEALREVVAQAEHRVGFNRLSADCAAQVTTTVDRATRSDVLPPDMMLRGPVGPTGAGPIAVLQAVADWERQRLGLASLVRAWCRKAGYDPDAIEQLERALDLPSHHCAAVMRGSPEPTTTAHLAARLGLALEQLQALTQPAGQPRAGDRGGAARSAPPSLQAEQAMAWTWVRHAMAATLGDVASGPGPEAPTGRR